MDITDKELNLAKPIKESLTKPVVKEAKEKKEKPKPQLTYYDVKVEALIPATLVYRILAEDAKQASEMIKNKQPNTVKYRLHGKKDIKLLVYDAGCTMIKFMKNLVGR
jgi:hypothetical protein